jgi:hypothetical protein
MSNYTEEQIKQMVHMGILNYPPSKCINILDIEDTEQFLKDFNTPGSEIYKAFKKGRDKAEYAIDMKLFEKAKNGDLKALQKYEERITYNR